MGIFQEEIKEQVLTNLQNILNKQEESAIELKHVQTEIGELKKNQQQINQFKVEEIEEFRQTFYWL